MPNISAVTLFAELLLGFKKWQIHLPTPPPHVFKKFSKVIRMDLSYLLLTRREIKLDVRAIIFQSFRWLMKGALCLFKKYPNKTLSIPGTLGAREGQVVTSPLNVESRRH